MHHTFDQLANNPIEALETTNLSFQRGNAGTKGSGHNFAHEVSDAQAAGVKNPGQHVADKMKASGIKPDVPELAPTLQSSSLPDSKPSKLETGNVLKTGEEALEKSGRVVVKAEEEALEKGGKALLKKLGTKALKVVPFVGIGAGLYSAEAEAAQGNYGTAALEGIGLIPIVGDVVDAARLGVAIGEAGSELLGIDTVAAEHGERFERAAKFVGLGEDASRIIGATGAALSSITVAPTIALQRKVMGWFT